MTSHPSFLTRPNYKTELSLSSLRNAAKQQRAAGLYNIATLWLFRRCWLQGGLLTDYVAYLAFRRDLGYPLSKHHRHKLESWYRNPLRKIYWRFSQHAASRIKNKLLAPPKQQQALERQFVQKIIALGAVQLVGNSADLKNAGLGMAVDKTALTLRFNRCFSEETQFTDTGKKTDIWVCAPDFKHAAPKHDWAILTGPDMMNWISNLPFSLLTQPNVLSVPLTIWRALVRELAAPPSAGVLVIDWLKKLAPSSRLFVIGFSFSASTHQYHHADKQHKAVTRHNWIKERELLQHWLSCNMIISGIEEIAN